MDAQAAPETTRSLSACSFFRLAIKKTEQRSSSLAFSRMLLRNQNSKFLGNRVASLASSFNHLRLRRLTQGFSSIVSAGLRRNTGRQQATPEKDREGSSHPRLPRTSRNRITMAEARDKSAASGEDSQTGLSRDAQNKLMTLTEEAKQAMLKMQRFDRYIYPFESEKILKVPIENELRRLQKIKSGNKSMWNTYYDNELTITCLYNHMKNLYELNRDLNQIDLLKVQNEQLQKRIIEANVQKQKELKEARAINRDAGGGANNALLNQYKSTTEFLISTLNQTNQRARRLLETQIKKANSPHKDLLEVTLDMVNELIQIQEGPNESIALQAALSKLLEQQNDSTRTLQALDRQRKNFEKAIGEAKTQQSRNMNQSLLNVCVYLVSLHSKIKLLKGQGSSRDLNSNTTERLKTDLQAERNRIRELQAKIQQLSKEKKALQDMKDITVITTWETQLTTIIEKIEKKDAYQADITKQRKLLAARKDNKFNGIIGVNLNLLDLLTRKERQLEKLERASVERRPDPTGPIKLMQEKLAKERQLRQDVEANFARISKELEEYKLREKNRDRDSQPLQNQINELFKICLLYEQAIIKRDQEINSSNYSPNGNNATSVELQRNRKTLQTRKKFSPTLLPAINVIDSLTRLILDAESNDKKRAQEEQRFELQRTKELTALDTMTKALMKLIESQTVRVDDALLNKIRKNLDTTVSKIQKGLDSPVSDLYDLYRNVVEVEIRLVALLDNAVKQATLNSQKALTSPKAKQQQETLRKRVQQLEQQLQTEKERFTTRQQEMNRLQSQEDSLNRRIQQLERQLEVEKGRYATRDQEWSNKDQELKSTKIELQTKEIQLKNLKNELNAKDLQIRNLKAENTKRVPQIERQLKSQREAVLKYAQSERVLNIRILDLQKSQGESKKQINEMNRQISDLNRTIADLQRQLKISGDSKERVRQLTSQLSEANKQVRELSSQLSDSNRTISDFKRKQQQFNRINSQQQQQQPYVQKLSEQNSQLKRAIEDNNFKINDLVNREVRLNGQIRELNEREAKLNQQIRDLARDLENANRAAKQKSDELEREKREAQLAKTEGQRGRDEANRNQNELQRYRDDAQRFKDEAERNRFQAQKAQNQVSKYKQEALRYKDQAQKTKDELFKTQIELQRVKDEVTRSRSEQGKSGAELSQLRSTIVILQNKLLVLTQISNTVKFLQQANKSLKDQNDVLRYELLQRNRSVSTSDSSRIQSLTNQLNQLKLDLNRLHSQHQRLLSTKGKDSETVTSLTNEVSRLNSIIISNESVFHQVVFDNQKFLKDINLLKSNEEKLKSTIKSLEEDKLRLSAAASSTLRQSQLNDEIRVLRQEKGTLEKELQSRQSAQTIINNLTEKETKLRNQKIEVERELMSKNNQLNQLKNKLARMAVETSQSQSNQQEVNRLSKLVRDLELRESDLKKLVDSNAKMYEQNQRRLNGQISSLKVQISNSSIQQSEIDRLRSTTVDRTLLDSKDRELNNLSSQLNQLKRQLSDLKRTNNPTAQRDLQQARISISKLQGQRSSLQQLFQQKKKDYDIILLELESRSRTETQQRQRAEQLERAYNQLQRQMSEQQVSWKAKLELGQLNSSNSRYVMVLEEKRLIEMEYNKVKAVLEKEYAFKRDIEDKFASMLQDKTKYLEKIDALQKTVHTKELELLRNYELREDSIRQLINENKKLQKQLRQINQKLSAEHRISTKSLQESLAKLESELSKLRRENTTLRDQIEDLEDQLIERSRNRTPKRSSRIQRWSQDENQGKYMLKVEGDKLKEEIQYLQSSNQKLKQKIRNIEDASVHSVRSGGESRRRIISNVNPGDDRLGHLNQRLSQKVKYLQRQRHTLYQRLKILSIFSRIQSPNHAFIQNLNRVLDNLLAFLNDSDEFSDSIITYGNFISQITESVSSENYERYFQSVEDFIKDLFLRTFESKNQILAKQAAQLIQFREQMSELVNQQIDYIEEEEERGTPRSSYHEFDRGQPDTAGMASFIALQHLFRLYLRAKSPEVLEEISHLLNVSQYPVQDMSN